MENQTQLNYINKVRTSTTTNPQKSVTNLANTVCLYHLKKFTKQSQIFHNSCQMMSVKQVNKEDHRRLEKE